MSKWHSHVSRTLHASRCVDGGGPGLGGTCRTYLTTNKYSGGEWLMLTGTEAGMARSNAPNGNAAKKKRPQWQTSFSLRLVGLFVSEESNHAAKSP